MNDIPITILRTDLFMRISFSIGIILLAYLIKRIIVLKINRTVKNIIVRHNYRKLTVYILGVIAFLTIIFVWLRRINFGIIFSIIGAGLIISLNDLILSFFGWLFIVVRKPFDVGERVQIGSVKGDVVDIRAFYVTLLEIEGWVKDEQSTGRIVHLPNNFIFKNPVYNYTKGFNFIWNELKITITFESNYKNAKDICLDFLRQFHNSWAVDLDGKIEQAQNIYAIYYKTLTPTVYVKIVENGILLSLRYLVEPHKRRFSENFLFENILNEFSKSPDINFAYPTYRLTK